MRHERASDAVASITNGMRVYLHGGAATPTALLEALAERATTLRNVETISMHLEGPAPHVAPALEGHLRHNALFIGANVREAVNAGRADFTPVFLSDIPALLGTALRPDVALIQVSLPDAQGYCSLGVSVDVARAAVDAADIVIAEVNARMPRTRGDSLVPFESIDHVIEVDRPLHTNHVEVDAVQRAIGRRVAELIDDGATLQLGIGGIAEGVLAALHDHRDLGVHTEMFSDGVVDLVEAGVVTGARKRLNPGLVIASFVMGTERLYRFVDDNPRVALFPASYTNDPLVIAQHGEMAAVNSAIEVDLTGQVCADSIGPRFWSGIGGQLDFIRGAARSKGGLPIIALPATAKNDTISRISPLLAEGSGVTTTRNDVHTIVTEYGVASLYGKSIRKRAEALINIAHPNFRDELTHAARKLGYL